MPSRTIEQLTPGLIASIPTASLSNLGALYYATDEAATYQCVETGAATYAWALVSGSPTKRDPLTGTGWTESVAGGTTIAWTAGTRARFSIPASTTGSGEINSSVFILTQESWDIAVRVQITTGDGSNATRIALIAGVDTNNSINLAMWGDGTIELGRVDGGSYLAAGFSAGPSSGQRTGGQLWLRLSNTGGVIRAMWGVGSAGAPPTSWTVQYSYADTVATKLSLGTFVRFTAFTLDTSVVAGYVVDLLAIRSSFIQPRSFS